MAKNDDPATTLDRRTLQPEEIERLLATELLVRVGFAVGEERYLLPFGYLWYAGQLCGITSPGRKIALAQQDPRVSFQVDTSATTGPFSWSSVTGQGIFTVTAEHARINEVRGLFDARLPDFPGWLRELEDQQLAAGDLRAWSIRPASMTGIQQRTPLDR